MSFSWKQQLLNGETDNWLDFSDFLSMGISKESHQLLNCSVVREAIRKNLKHLAYRFYYRHTGIRYVQRMGETPMTPKEQTDLLATGIESDVQYFAEELAHLLESNLDYVISEENWKWLILPVLEASPEVLLNTN